MRSSRIAGMGSSIPEKVLTNFDLERMVDTSDTWIVERTGIRERHIVGEDVAASDLAVEAAWKALEDARVKASEVDLIIVATVTPDMYFPATACIVQDRLGAKGAGGFDLEAGCTGFIYGLSIAHQFISSGRYDTVLVIGVETLSKLVNWSDRNTCVLFGDGAGAVVVRPAPLGKGILATHLGADGGGGSHLYVPAGGSRCPPSIETVTRGMHYIHMNGPEVFKFAVKVVSQASLSVLRRSGLKKGDIDLMVPHQANLRIINSAAERLGLTPEKVVINIERYGNISSASIPVALEEAYRQGRISEGDVVLLVSFGAGLTWGSCVMRWCSSDE